MSTRAIGVPDRDDSAASVAEESAAISDTLARLSSAALIAQPIVFAAATLLARASELPTTPESLIRPFIVLASVSGIALVGARLLTRSWPLAAIISSALVLFTLREAIPAALLGAFALWWILITLLRRRTGRPGPDARVPRAVARASGIFAWVSLAFWTATAWGAMTIAAPEVQAPDAAGASEATSGAEPTPNVYVLLLDGYPRADTLRETFGYDNSSFVDGLEDLGFDVPMDVRSNYNKTWLTLASMLNGQYVDDIMEGSPPPEGGEQLRILQQLIDRATMLDPLRERGYRLLTGPSPITSTNRIPGYDVDGHAALTHFELRLIEASPWTLVFRDQAAGLLMNSERTGVLTAIDYAMDNARERGADPIFLLSHVHAPHGPFALGADGPGPMQDCVPVQCTLRSSTIEEMQIDLEAFRSGLLPHLEHLNALLLDAVSEIVSEDPDAVIILMSDHGIRYSYTDEDEHFDAFLAARTPGHAGLFAEGTAPVNLLRRLLSAYLSVEYPELSYEAWTADWSQYLRLVPFQAGRGPVDVAPSDDARVSLMLNTLEARFGSAFWHQYLVEVSLDGAHAVAVTSNVLVSSRLCGGLAASAVDMDDRPIGVDTIEIRDTLGNSTFECEVEGWP